MCLTLRVRGFLCVAWFDGSKVKKVLEDMERESGGWEVGPKGAIVCGKRQSESQIGRGSRIKVHLGLKRRRKITKMSCVFVAGITSCLFWYLDMGDFFIFYFQRKGENKHTKILWGLNPQSLGSTLKSALIQLTFH